MNKPQSELSLLWHVFVAGQKVKQLLVSAMADAPLRPDEYAVYSVLHDLGPKPPTELARLLGMPPTTMSHYVRAMLDRGHARKSRSPADGRSFVLTLTEHGSAAHLRSGQLFESANRRFRSALSVDEAFLAQALNEIGDAAEVAAAEGRTRERVAG